MYVEVDLRTNLNNKCKINFIVIKVHSKLKYQSKS